MDNVLWNMMMNNARVHLNSINPEKPTSDDIDVFRISEVLAILTGKLKEEIVIEIIKTKL